MHAYRGREGGRTVRPEREPLVSRRIAGAGLAALLTVGLSGCVPPQPEPGPTSTPTATVPFPTPTVAPERIRLDVAASGDLGVAVYSIGTYTTTKDSGFSPPESDVDFFPTGTQVFALEFALESVAAGGATADVTGLDLEGTQYEGRPELAVLDENEGPAYVETRGLPWLVDGLFDGAETPWLVEYQEPASFAAAWYVPPHTTELKITINAPNTAELPLTFTIEVPAPPADH